MGGIQDHIEKLPSLVAIAENKSVTKAAAALGMTQPALSRQVRILEEVVGSALLERSSQGVTLTAAGVELVSFSRKMSLDIRALEERVGSHATTNQIIRIGTFDSLSIRLWPKLVGEAAEHFPDWRLGVRSGDHEELLELLKSSEVDCVMSIIMRNKDKSLVVRELFEDSYGFFCSPKFRTPAIAACATERKKCPIALVQTARCRSGDSIAQILSAKSIEFKRILPVDTFEAAANYAREGVAVAVLPYVIAGSSLKKGKLVPYVTPEIPDNRFGHHKMGFYWNAGSSKRAALRSLNKILASYFSREFGRAELTAKSLDN